MTNSLSNRSAPCRAGARAWLAGLAVVLLGLLATAPAASAEPIWYADTNFAPANLEPGGTGMVLLMIRNHGSESSGEMTVNVELPPGVTLHPYGFPDKVVGNFGESTWECTGTGSVTCVNPTPGGDNFGPDVAPADGPLLPYTSYADRLRFPVDIAADASGTHQVTTTLSGAGATSSFAYVDPVTISSTPAGFGMQPGSFRAGIYAGPRITDPPVTQAASHPYEMRVNFDMSLINREEQRLPAEFGFPPTMVVTPAATLRTVKTTLPRGLVGNPEATPKCTSKDFLEASPYDSFMPNCPQETQVGVVDVVLSLGNGEWMFDRGTFSDIPVFNLPPPKGQAADFGFSIAGVRSHIYATADPSKNYAISALTPYVPETGFKLDVRHVKFRAWGVPADPAHDNLRLGPRVEPAPDSKIMPFLTAPSACGQSGAFSQAVESYEVEGLTPEVESSSPPVTSTGCEDERIRFEPEVKLQPTSRAASGPTGLKVSLLVPQRDQRTPYKELDKLYEQNGSLRGVDTPPMKKAVVTLPEGMTISTSAAQGLGSCSLAQIGLGTNDPVTCPESSVYGALTIKTPILPEDQPMVGQIYIAKQNDNPFDNFLSLYLVIQQPERGLLVKIPGKVDLDPVTGQIRTTFDDLPQFPVSEMEMSLKGGVRAALVNPTTCGTKTIKAEFYSWHEPNTPVTRTSSYEVTAKGDGSPCVNHLAERLFKPDMDAGTVSSSAGSYSPFLFRIQRSDDDQEFSQLNVKLPPGLLAKIAGVEKCPEAAIAAVEAPGRIGTAEASSPSCPASSQIGTTDVGSGVGQVLTYIPGKAYLAGPYKGAPLSMLVVTPILAGPYDLGVIAVRSRIDVDRETAQAAVVTDPFPQIFKGIPVRIRDIRVKVDREKTMINPTNCTPMAVLSRVTGTGGDVNSTADDTAAELSERFQASDCGSLPFKPKLSFRLRGGTNRSDYPALTATLKARPGDANLARTKVTLPHSVFLAQEHIGTVCTRVQFAARQCPAASVYGRATAVSPLFDGALEGPVYLRSNGGERLLPDLVVALDGEIDVVLSGFIDSKNERIRNTFDVIPDAPVTRFTLSMFGGKKGLLVNSRNLCKGKARADVRMTGQNGKVWNTRPLMANSCGKKGSKRRAR